MTVLAEVDWSAIWKVVWGSLTIGVGVSAVFSLALYAGTRFSELRSQGRAGAALPFGALALIAFGGFLVAVVLGLIVMTRK